MGKERLSRDGRLRPNIERGGSSRRVSALIVMALAISGPREVYSQQTVSPQGLPQHVVPTYPEPGLPTFTYPQGGQFLIDTGAVAGATVITSDGSSPPTFTGTGSGVAGATVASGYTNFVGQEVGSGQCVALAQATSNVGNTSTWEPGAQVQGNTNIAAGTVIATFGSDGSYTNTPGQSHTAIYLGQNDQGIQVMDQWATQPATYRTIKWTTSNPYESGSQFYVVSH